MRLFIFSQLQTVGTYAPPATTMMTNHAGASVEDMLFYPWGQVWRSWGSGGYNFAELAYYDTTTNTGLTTFRVYSPGLGRWHSPDPLAGNITNPQSLNRYAYVLNNPTGLVDPLGLDCKPGTANCKHPPECYGMVCADQYYGGSLFKGFTSFEMPICVINGVMGYCNQGALASFMSPTGNDEFDAIMQANGMSFTPAGLPVDASGRISTGTGSLTFDEGAWMQAMRFIDSGILGEYAPRTGYGTIMAFNGIQSAAFGTFAESLAPMTGTDFLSALYATTGANALNNNGSLSSFDWTGNVTGSVSGGVVTLYIFNPTTHAPVGTWSLPAPPWGP